VPHKAAYSDLALKLWKKGLADEEIAKECGVHVITIAQWRRYHKLRPPTNIYKAKHQARFEAWLNGMTAKEMSEAGLGKKQALDNWHSKNKLKVNSKNG
jgi:uncharacterized protein YjcR